jgi:hypothetical protein
MNFRLISIFVGSKLRDRSTYILALIVGSIINLYGQILLPWFRGSFDPPSDLLIEYEIRPAITILSIFLGFLFPFCVGLYSAVTMRYKNRRTEAIARLPGKVQGVVVQITTPAPSSSGRDARITGKRAQTVVETWS